MNKRNVISWLAYDLGNSFFVTAISGLFLAQWLILDNKLDDIWYGAGFSIATILVLVSSPFWGTWSDKIGKRMPFLIWTSVALFIFNGLIAVVAVSNLYNSLLKEVSTEKNRGKVSGLGEGFNSIGWLLGSVILLPFASGAITLIGQPGRPQVFIPAFIISTLLMLPMLFLFKEQPRSKENSIVRKETLGKKTIAGIKQLFHENKNVGIFLVAFGLTADIVITLTLYFAIVMDALYHVDDNIKTLAFVVNLICAIVFGYILGKLGDKYGHKLMLFISCIFIIVGASIFFLSSSLSALYTVMVIAGIGGGGYFVLSRSLMIKISPQNQLGEYFGLYSAFGRTASIIAPLIWGGITLSLRDYAVLKYQIAGMVMVGLLVIGTLLLLKVEEKEAGESSVAIG
jgi:UMF1 family MFS transporter